MSREDEIRARLVNAKNRKRVGTWESAYATDIAYLLDRIKELEAEK